MYASDLLKYCHCPPVGDGRLPVMKYAFPAMAFPPPAVLGGAPSPVGFLTGSSSSNSSLDTLTSVAQQSFGLGLKQMDQQQQQQSVHQVQPLGMGFQPLSRAHASSVSSNSSTSSSSSSQSSSKSSLKDSQRKKRSNLPKKSTSILMAWLNDNISHPYPNSKEKLDLIRKTGLTPQQLSNWFINARRRKLNTLSPPSSQATTTTATTSK